MWNKFKEGFLELLEIISNVFFAIVVVYILAWILGQPADNVVGWSALGIAAATAPRTR